MNRSLRGSVTRALGPMSLAALAGLAVIAGGCASGGSSSSLADTSDAVEVAPFVAPNDPSMGQIVLMVSEVDVWVPQCVGDIGSGVRSQLISSLAASPNFIIADRAVLSDIAAEHKLAASGAMPEGDGPIPGQLTGARVLVKAAVTEFKEDVTGTAKGGGFRPGPLLGFIGGIVGGAAGDALKIAGAVDPTLGGGKQTIKGVVGLDIRLLDIDSGTVIGTTRALGDLTRENSTSVFQVAGISFSDAKFAQSVLGQATRAAVEDGVRKVHELMRTNVAATATGSSATALASTTSAITDGGSR